MRSAETRDLMTKRVQEAHKKWPSFDKMPELTEPAKIKVAVEGDPNDNTNYVAALYDLCGYGAIPTGRYKGQSVIGGNPEERK